MNGHSDQPDRGRTGGEARQFTLDRADHAVPRHFLTAALVRAPELGVGIGLHQRPDLDGVGRRALTNARSTIACAIAEVSTWQQPSEVAGGGKG